MPGLRVEFFADPEDMRRLLETFRSLGSFRYTAMTGKVNREPTEHDDPVGLLQSSLVTPDDPNRGFGYLVTDASTVIKTRKIELADGSGFKILLGQNLTPDSVIVSLGGEIGDETLISSTVHTMGESDRARDLFALFKRAISKASSRVSGHYVMPCALRKLEQGWRLTEGKNHHRDLDLKKP